VVYEEITNGSTVDKLVYNYGDNGLVGFTLNGTEYFYVRNAQSDIIGILDSNRTQVVSYTYDTWGKLISITGDKVLGEKNPYRYRGYRYDTETGYYYLQSRYYNPDWGRFVNADIFLGQPGELLSHDMFIYSMNDPINMKDPSGFRPIYTTGVETDAMRKASLQVMNAVSKKEPPPSEVGYRTPKGKGKTGTVKLPNGQRGWGDADGNVWVPIPEGHPLAHGGEHWDVNYPNGGYDNVYPPDGHVRKGSGPRGSFSPEGKRIVMESTGIGGTALLLYGVYRVARMAPSFAPPLWWTIPANVACP